MIEDLDAEYCSDAEAVTLVANAEGGIFTINSSESTVFDPSILGGGTHTIEYSFAARRLQLFDQYNG